MFSAFSIITDSFIPPPGGTGRQLPEPTRRPQSTHQRTGSGKASTVARPLSIVTDIISPPTTRPQSRQSSRPPNARRPRSRSVAAQRDALAGTRKRNSTVIPDEADAPGSREQVYRWDGIIGARSDWDAIRRDNELWTPEGDALVHFYAHGQSRRGPSIRLAFADVEQCNCTTLLAESLVRGQSAWELYLPAPRRLDRNAAFAYHLTTRNLFAWMFDRPLVGSQLGPALIALHERLDAARPDTAENFKDMLAYIESQGYADFRDNPDHAVGALVYAEHFQLAELWTDAFVHCAGQHEQLADTLDWPSVSRTSKALLSRAACEMQVRLERASDELSAFMEPSMARLGLADDVERHLERFRSFLHGYYVQTIGYWPPASASNILPKHVLRSMYTDFRSLYELLADADPAEPAWGGITGSTTGSVHATTRMDVPATLRAFDRRSRYPALPCTQPLLPTNLPVAPDTLLGNMLPPLFGSTKRARTGRRAAIVAALQQATNAPTTAQAAAAPLVREYREFERTSTLQESERLSPATARAARWVLVYAALQTLADVTRAPPEVCDADGVGYPLCCQTAGTPPWNTTNPGDAIEMDAVETAVVAPPTAATPTPPHAAIPTLATPPQAATVRASSPVPSTAPSALVAPLNLARVATEKKRRSLVVYAPRPRRPSDGAQAMLDAYSSSDDDEPRVDRPPTPPRARDSVAAADDVPGLSPTSDRYSHHSRHSSDGSSTRESEARTPTSARADAEHYFALEQAKARAQADTVEREGERYYDAPPSPSIYGDEAESRNRSEFDLLGAMGKGPGSEELAARWRGEIGF